MILIDAPSGYSQQWMQQALASVSEELGRCLKRAERIYVGPLVDTQIVLLSPNGTKYKIEVDDSGVISTSAVV